MLRIHVGVHLGAGCREIMRYENLVFDFINHFLELAVLFVMRLYDMIKLIEIDKVVEL